MSSDIGSTVLLTQKPTLKVKKLTVKNTYVKCHKVHHIQLNEDAEAMATLQIADSKQMCF